MGGHWLGPDLVQEGDITNEDRGRGRAARWRLFLIERDTDPTRLSPDNATMMIAVLCVDNQVE
jgi:hypothetical protein